MMKAELETIEAYDDFRKRYKEYSDNKTPEAKLRLIKEIDESLGKLNSALEIKKDQKSLIIAGEDEGEAKESPSAEAETITDYYDHASMSSMRLFAMLAAIAGTLALAVAGWILPAIGLGIIIYIEIAGKKTLALLRDFFHWRIVRQTKQYQSINNDIKQIKYAIMMLKRMRLRLYVS